jgi:hypothetical protein
MVQLRQGGTKSLAAKSGFASAYSDAIAFVLNFFAWLYQKTVVELLLRQKRIQFSGDGRCIPLRIEHVTPLMDPRRGHPYISNDIRTARYTPWDFIPKQLFFQFSRVGNFYFLCVGIPQMVRETHPPNSRAFSKEVIESARVTETCF